MSSGNRIAGTIRLTVAGETISLAGDFTMNPGTPQREALLSPGGEVQGYKESYRAPFVEGDIRYKKGLELKEFFEQDGIDAQLTLATGETWVFIDGWVNGTGDLGTGEGTIAFRFDAKRAERV